MKQVGAVRIYLYVVLTEIYGTAEIVKIFTFSCDKYGFGPCGNVSAQLVSGEGSACSRVHWATTLVFPCVYFTFLRFPKLPRIRCLCAEV